MFQGPRVVPGYSKFQQAETEHGDRSNQVAARRERAPGDALSSLTASTT